MSGTKLTDSSKLIKAIKEKIDGHVVDIIEYAIHGLLSSTDFASEYHNVTGNTFSSYSCGVYIDKRLIDVFQSQDVLSRKKPTRVTLKRGERYDKPYYYDGDEVGKNPYVGETTNGNYYGSDIAMKFLAGYTPTKNGYAICMCTGTYYSEYIEKSKNLNVLTETMLASKSIFLSSLKPIS